MEYGVWGMALLSTLRLERVWLIRFFCKELFLCKPPLL